MLSAQTTSSTVPKIVGEPLSEWIVVLAGLAVLVAVLVAGVVMRHRMRQG